MVDLSLAEVNSKRLKFRFSSSLFTRKACKDALDRNVSPLGLKSHKQYLFNRMGHLI